MSHSLTYTQTQSETAALANSIAGNIYICIISTERQSPKDRIRAADEREVEEGDEGEGGERLNLQLQDDFHGVKD